LDNSISKNVTVLFLGTGDLKLWATNTLILNHSGIGDVSYKGDPEIESNKKGIGKIQKL
jgi:hypothetical protein